MPLVISAQDAMDDFIDESEISSITTEIDLDLPVEKLLKISPSRKILLITNENQSFGPGDYITLIYENKMMVRALCAKLTEQQAGIKIINVHDIPLWESAYFEMPVKILKGDEAQFLKMMEGPEQHEAKIEDNEDLYNDTELLINDDDSTLIEENKNRLIKPDNILSLNYGLLKGINSGGDDHNYGHWTFNWGYQIIDNIWTEFSGGQALIGQFPSSTLETRVTSVTARLKYTIDGPFYSYFLPYIGYQKVLADSPDAGFNPPLPNTQQTQEELDREVELLYMMKKNQFIFGVSWYKRVVPGWFIRVDVGTDFVSSGLALEF